MDIEQFIFNLRILSLDSQSLYMSAEVYKEAIPEASDFFESMPFQTIEISCKFLLGQLEFPEGTPKQHINIYKISLFRLIERIDRNIPSYKYSENPQVIDLLADLYFYDDEHIARIAVLLRKIIVNNPTGILEHALEKLNAENNLITLSRFILLQHGNDNWNEKYNSFIDYISVLLPHFIDGRSIAKDAILHIIQIYYDMSNTDSANIFLQNQQPIIKLLDFAKVLINEEYQNLVFGAEILQKVLKYFFTLMLVCTAKNNEKEWEQNYYLMFVGLFGLLFGGFLNFVEPIYSKFGEVGSECISYVLSSIKLMYYYLNEEGKNEFRERIINLCLFASQIEYKFENPEQQFEWMFDSVYDLNEFGYRRCVAGGLFYSIACSRDGFIYVLTMFEGIEEINEPILYLFSQFINIEFEKLFTEEETVEVKERIEALEEAIEQNVDQEDFPSLLQVYNIISLMPIHGIFKDTLISLFDPDFDDSDVASKFVFNLLCKQLSQGLLYDSLSLEDISTDLVETVIQRSDSGYEDLPKYFLNTLYQVSPESRQMYSGEIIGIQISEIESIVQSGNPDFENVDKINMIVRNVSRNILISSDASIFEGFGQRMVDLHQLLFEKEFDDNESDIIDLCLNVIYVPGAFAEYATFFEHIAMDPEGSSLNVGTMLTSYIAVSNQNPNYIEDPEINQAMTNALFIHMNNINEEVEPEDLIAIFGFLMIQLSKGLLEEGHVDAMFDWTMEIIQNKSHPNRFAPSYMFLMYINLCNLKELEGDLCQIIAEFVANGRYLASFPRGVASFALRKWTGIFGDENMNHIANAAAENTLPGNNAERLFDRNDIFPPVTIIPGYTDNSIVLLPNDL